MGNLSIWEGIMGYFKGTKQGNADQLCNARIQAKWTEIDLDHQVLVKYAIPVMREMLGGNSLHFSNRFPMIRSDGIERCGPLFMIHQLDIIPLNDGIGRCHRLDSELYHIDPHISHVYDRKERSNKFSLYPVAHHYEDRFTSESVNTLKSRLERLV